MKKTFDLVEDLFRGRVGEDIANFMLENYAKVNKQETRIELSLSNRSIASNYSDANWASIKNYILEANLGKCVEKSGKRRWLINNLCFNINKVNENLRPSNLYLEDTEQLKLDLEIPAADVSINHPLVIGYISDANRTFIKEIHVIKYKSDGSVDWNLEIYNVNNAVVAETPVVYRDVKTLLKTKSPSGNIINMFDKD